MSDPDLSKLIFISSVNAFKNNDAFSGSFSISGTVDGGTNTQTFSIQVPSTTDMASVIFNGPTDTVSSLDPRPSDGWFTQGAVWVLGTGAGVGSDYPTNWTLNSSISGTTLTVTANYVQQFVDPITLTATTVYFRLIDYSIF